MIISISCILIVLSAQTYAEDQCSNIIINKKEWDARVTTYKPDYLTPPVDLVIIQHTVTQTCNDDKTCAEIVREIQKIHIEQSLIHDIGLSFLIGNNGKVYEGRGWNQMGIHSHGYNKQSIGIAFIGNFNNQEPTAKALESAKALLQCGVEDDRLSKNYTVVCHSQLLPTESPGKKVIPKVMSWPNWKEYVTDIIKNADKAEQQPQPEIENQPKAVGNDLILSRPKQIDTLWNVRDDIAELISSLRELGQKTQKVVENLSKEFVKHTELFLATILSGVKGFKDQISSAVGSISSVPGVNKCVEPMKQKANSIFDETDAKAHSCVNEKADEINVMIKQINDAATDIITFSDTSLDITRNCTELNHGIQSPTKVCLNSVTVKVQNAQNNFDTLQKDSITTINVAIQAVPKALDSCGMKILKHTNDEIGKIISDIVACPTKSVLGGFGFGR